MCSPLARGAAWLGRTGRNRARRASPRRTVRRSPRMRRARARPALARERAGVAVNRLEHDHSSVFSKSRRYSLWSSVCSMRWPARSTGAPSSSSKARSSRARTPRRRPRGPALAAPKAWSRSTTRRSRAASRASRPRRPSPPPWPRRAACPAARTPWGAAPSRGREGCGGAPPRVEERLGPRAGGSAGTEDRSLPALVDGGNKNWRTDTSRREI